MKLKEPPVDDASQHAVARLFEEHKVKLLAMLRRRLDPALAPRIDPDDILHKAFLRARDRWEDHLRSGMSAYAWLYRLVRDVLFDEYRFNTSQRRNLRLEEAWPDGSASELASAFLATGTGPQSAAERKELQDRVRQTLASLKAKDRELLGMRFFDQLSFEEIAQVLEITANTARQRYFRAALHFKEAWTELYGPEDLQP